MESFTFSGRESDERAQLRTPFICTKTPVYLYQNPRLSVQPETLEVLMGKGFPFNQEISPKII